MFNFRTVLDLLESCEDGTHSFHTPHTQCPLLLTSDNGTVATINKTIFGFTTLLLIKIHSLVDLL